METTYPHERLKKFVKHELAQIEKPGNPGQVHHFTDVERLVKALSDFLAFHVDEPTVGRLESAFWNAVEPLLAEDLAVRSLPDCVEKLAATFESFLKKIAFLRYKSDTLRWNGDGVNYIGLVNTTLADLIRGLVGKTKAGQSTADVSAPIVDARGTKGAIYGKAREVRNNVHRAQDYSLAETIALARTVLASYLLAVEDNRQVIEQSIYPQYRYLQKVVEAFRLWERQYIELESQEEKFMPDIGVLEPVAFEWEPVFDRNKDNIQQVSDANSGEGNELEILKPRRLAPISYFVRECPRLAVIGGGGCGKTTTVQRLVLKEAQRLLSNPSENLPIPVLIEANRYSLTFRFFDLIESELGISTDETENLLNEGKLALFFDGLNEIAAPVQPEALVELKNLIARWPKPRIILSSRKSGYQNLLGVPTVELQELSDTQIERFLAVSLADPEHGRSLYSTLKSNPQLMEWARNPLLLRMLTKVAGSGDLPRNRGQMLNRFVSWILSRERKTHPTNVETKEDVLSHLAFQMRKAGNVMVQKPIAIELIRERLAQLAPAVGANDLFQELVENQLLKRTQHDEIRFFHELIQEYFAARELTRLFMLDPTSIKGLMKDTRWEEPIILMAGFLGKKESLVQALCQSSLLLAAKCVAPLRDDSPDTCEFVRREATETLDQICRDVINQGWTRINIREVVGAVSILNDEKAIRLLCARLPSFSIVSHDAILDGLASCEKSLLQRIFLDADVFKKLMASAKNNYLIKHWFRAIEGLTAVADIEQAIKLCGSVGSLLSLQIACGFDPEIALREINPFTLNFGAKSLRKLFSLVNAEKHGPYLQKIVSEDYNPLRVAAAIRLAVIKDETALPFLIEKCIGGEQSEKGSIFAALAHYGKQRVSEAALLLLSQGAITLQQLVTCPVGDYIEMDEKVLRASPGLVNYFAWLLRSGAEDQAKFALSQIVKLSLGDLFREPLIEIIRSSQSKNESVTVKQQMRIYEALKGQRFRGIIMLNDTERGIGSIWCDETQNFYFLHQSEVWDKTPVAIYDAVEFEVATGRKPKKDFDAVKISKLPENEIKGTIERIVPERAFGLIRTNPENPSFFFHFENVSAAELDRLAPGIRVGFVVVPRLKETHSVQAVRVRLI